MVKHKKKISLVPMIVLSVILLTLTSCSTSKISYTAEISPPEKNNISLYGTWVVEHTLDPLNFTDSKNNTPSLVGTSLSFKKDKAEINSSEYYNLNYKIKSVSTEDYFINTYKVNPKTIDINNNSIKVITLSRENIFLNNFAFINEDSIITSFNDVLYYLKRVSNSVTPEPSNSKVTEFIESISPTMTSSLVDTQTESSEEKASTENNLTQSGMLLCLKSYKKNDYKIPCSLTDDSLEPTYRTLWISFNGYYMNPIEEIPTILLPRKTGFWQIDVNRVVDVNYVKDYIYAYPINSKISERKNITDLTSYSEFNHLIDINFIGNDYLSLNYSGAGLDDTSSESYNYQLMRMVSIDTLYSHNETYISIKKILGDSSYTALQEGAIAFSTWADDKTKESLESTVDELSFGVYREKAQWILKGRLNTVDKATKGNYADFSIPMVPSKELVSFDTLYPSWLSIKEKVPDAIDAYSSPLENFIIILTSKKILLYSMENGVLCTSPLVEFDMKEGEVPVMSQWATGNYVDSWSETFNSLKK
jgi:hypothetical protein